MLSLKSFVGHCQTHLDERAPFLAYWYSRGFGLMRTGEAIFPWYDIRFVDEDDRPRKYHARNDLDRDRILRDLRRRSVSVPTVTAINKVRKVKASTIASMRRAIVQMQKDPYTYPELRVVQYDGSGLSIDGDPAGLEALHVRK